MQPTAISLTVNKNLLLVSHWTVSPLPLQDSPTHEKRLQKSPNSRVKETHMYQKMPQRILKRGLKLIFKKDAKGLKILDPYQSTRSSRCGRHVESGHVTTAQSESSGDAKSCSSTFGR